MSPPPEERPMAKAKKAKPIELFIDGPERIVNQDKKEVSILEAKKLWDAGKVTNFNLSLKRLATRCGWDFNELARQYGEMERNRRQGS
jgi:hypothetical protein